MHHGHLKIKDMIDTKLMLLQTLFLLGLSFLCHCIVWEEDWVQSPYWKIFWAIVITGLCFLILLPW
jgi:hypothetical protein